MSDPIRTYLARYRNRKMALAGILTLSAAQAASLVPVALIVRDIFDRALPQLDARGLVWRIGLIPALFALNSLVVLLNRQLTLTVIKRAISGLRVDLLDRVAKLARGSYVRLDTGGLHDKIVHDTERVDSMTSAFLAQIMPGILVMIVLSQLLLRQSAHLFILVLVAVPLVYAVDRLLRSVVFRRLSRFHGDFSEFSKGALFMLQHGELIRLSTAEEMELSRQRDRIRNLEASGRDMAWMTTAYAVAQGNVVVIVGALVLLVGGLQVIGGSMTTGALLSYYVNLNLLNMYMRNVFGALPAITEGLASLNTLARFLPDDGAPESVGSAFPGFSGSLVIEDVHFRHAGASHGLSAVNFTVRMNRTFGILGASGSGKTTLIHLLTGLHVPRSGRVLVDGTDIRDFDGASYRRKIGVLQQHPTFFSGTIRENLAYGVPDATEERMREACRTSEIDEFVESLEKGYETAVGESGVTLSGGEKQRLAIARALLRDPELLILDEPDNNLNPEMIRRILGAIKARGTTVVLISHDRDLMSGVDDHYEII